MTMEFRLGDDDGVDGVGSNGDCIASWEGDHLAPVAQARIASSGGCTVGENVHGKTSEFATALAVADPLLVSMQDRTDSHEQHHGP